jgi:DNA-binding transcriptional LysR family regulator
LEVVESGGFSAAARRLGVAPSSVSRQVDLLEAHLGARLLVRSTRRVRLTEAGERYQGHASRILTEVEEAAAQVSELTSIPQGSLRLDVVSPFGRRYIAPVLAEFHRRYPKLKVELTLSDRIVDLVEQEVDLAIRVGVLDDSRLVARRLAPSRLLVCGSPDYLRRRGIPRTLQDLGEHDCLSFRQEHGPATWTLGDTAVPISGPLQSNDVESLLIAARTGLGLVNLPDWLVMEELRTGGLQVAFANDDGGRAGLYALYPERSYLPAKVRLFLDFIIEQIGSPAPWESGLTVSD